jgi:hypothetical protein
VTAVTAEPHVPGHRIPARTPAEIRAALTGPDRAEFERRYRAALDRAATDYDLTALHDVVEEWWQVAVLTADPAAHQRMLDTAAALRAGEPVHSTPWDVVRADLGV